MKLILLFAVIVTLINAVPLSLVKHRNSSLLEHRNSSLLEDNLISSALAVNVNPKIKILLQKMMLDADPVKLNTVITLVEELLNEARNVLAGLVGTSDTANSAYDSALAAYNQAVVDRDQSLQDEAALITAAEDAVVSAQNHRDQVQITQDQAVADALSAKQISTGAKDTAASTLADQQSNLNTEISSLEQVLSILQTILSNGNGLGKAYLATTDDAGLDVWLVPIPPFAPEGVDGSTLEVCGSKVFEVCQSVGLNTACWNLEAQKNVDLVSADPNCRTLTVNGHTNSWFRYQVGGLSCTEPAGSKYKCPIWGGDAPNVPAIGPTFVDVYNAYGGCGTCGIKKVANDAQWCYHHGLVDGVGYAVCAGSCTGSGCIR